MATEVGNLKQKIFEEDVITGAAASEVTMTKFAGSVNLLLDCPTVQVHFDIHGSYNIIGVPDNKVDKFYMIPFDCEIVCSYFYVGQNNGSSGVTEIDIVKKPLIGVESSIFSTRPIIPASAGGEADIIQEHTPAPLNIRLASGGVAPILASSILNKYDVLKFNIIQKPSGIVDKSGFVLFLRAI